jgi:hypothetical protein
MIQNQQVRKLGYNADNATMVVDGKSLVKKSHKGRTIAKAD